jgi:hypothetical protein
VGATEKVALRRRRITLPVSHVLSLLRQRGRSDSPFHPGPVAFGGRTVTPTRHALHSFAVRSFDPPGRKPPPRVFCPDSTRSFLGGTFTGAKTPGFMLSRPPKSKSDRCHEEEGGDPPPPRPTLRGPRFPQAFRSLIDLPRELQRLRSHGHISASGKCWCAIWRGRFNLDEGSSGSFTIPGECATPVSPCANQLASLSARARGPHDLIGPSCGALSSLRCSRRCGPQAVGGGVTKAASGPRLGSTATS